MNQPLPPISATERLAAAFGNWPALPDRVHTMCDALLMDLAGICVAARNSDYVQATVAASDEAGPCTVIGRAQGASPAAAALCNGTAAHGEDYDDTFEGGPIHAGAVIVPAVLATAERHGLSGVHALAGIAVG